MNKSARLFKQIMSIVMAFVLVSPAIAQTQPQAVQNLSFQADIFGSSTPENIEYLSDLNFYSWGGFGVNAHVYRAFLQGGDQIAYAVSADNPNAFTLNVSALNSSTPITLTVTKSEYSAGVVTMPSANQLNFVWDIQESGFSLKLHKTATLVFNPAVTAKYVISETFTIENLGPYFDLNSFSEYLHMDDISRLRDFDGDGMYETLLAINNFSTSGYPVFGKIYLRRQSTTTDFVNDGRYATVNHYPLYKPFPTGVAQEIVRAAYVTGLTKNSTAEQQVASDARLLLAARPCEIPFFAQVDDNWKDHPLRGTCTGWCIDPKTGYVTVGKCGCTLTSAAMVFNTYGASTNPSQLSDCMNTSACPYAWATGATCSQGKAKLVSRPGFSWATLDQQLNQNHRPILLGMCKKGTCQYDYDNDPETYSQTHWVVVLNGQGSDPANYRIHDPALKCGANIPLSTRSGDWEFSWMGIYEGTVPCSSLTALTPPCVSRGANPQPVQFNSGQSANDAIPSPIISSSSAVSGTVWIYTRTELTMTVEITAASSVGIITDMLIWSDTMSNTTWQSFTPFVWLPVSNMVYASFRDNLGNVTDVYSDTINPAGPPNAPLQVFLPLIRR